MEISIIIIIINLIIDIKAIMANDQVINEYFLMLDEE